jgi:hypothetical protein
MCAWKWARIQSGLFQLARLPRLSFWSPLTNYPFSGRERHIRHTVLKIKPCRYKFVKSEWRLLLPMVTHHAASWRLYPHCTAFLDMLSVVQLVEHPTYFVKHSLLYELAICPYSEATPCEHFVTLVFKLKKTEIWGQKKRLLGKTLLKGTKTGCELVSTDSRCGHFLETRSYSADFIRATPFLTNWESPRFSKRKLMYSRN